MKKSFLLIAMFAVLCVSTSQGINVAVSGTSQEGNQPIIDFLVDNFDATVTFGDFSNPANIPADTELFIVGRVLGSWAYSNAANSAIFNGLDIPVVCFTSYIARPDSDRWGWHSGGIGDFHTLSGEETVVTAAGADVFGIEGPVDWWNDATWGFSAPGTGSVGDGQILATSPSGQIVVAAWKAGDLTGMGVELGSDRLLFNVPDQGSGNPADLPNTAAGIQALIDAFNYFLGAGDGPYDPQILPDNGDGSVGILQPNNEDVVVTLAFKAGGDPNTESANPYPVNPDILGHYIYLSTATDPNLALVDYVVQVHNPDPYLTDPSISYGPITLVGGQGKVFYWQVEEGLDDGTGNPYGAGDPNNILGPVWSFNAIGATPVILSGPDHAIADENGNASYTLTANALAGNFRWFKVGEPDVQLSDGGIYSGTQTDTLIINGATVADEGQFYCIAYNGDPEGVNIPSEPSPAAWLWIPRLVSHYSFEDMNNPDPNTFITPDVVSGLDLIMMSDDTGTDVPVLGSGLPELTPAQYGLLFDNPAGSDPAIADAQYAVAANGVGDYMDITISVWVNWNGGGIWQRIVDFGNNTDEYIFLTPSNGGEMRFAVKNVDEQYIATSPLPMGEWTFVTATLSGDTARLYVNGELVQTGTITHDPIDYAPAANNYVGKSQWPDPYFNGTIDDLKIYNYARTTEQIAQDYLDLRGEWICNNELYDLPYDFDGNCRVDLADFATIAAAWMDTYRIYPTE